MSQTWISLSHPKISQGASTARGNCMQICPSFLLELPFIPWCCCFHLTTCSTALPTMHPPAATRTHTHTHTQTGWHTHTHTHVHTRTPSLPPKKATYPQVSFHSKKKQQLVFLCSPSSVFSCLSSAAEKGHICLKALLGRNHLVQNKDSRGCLNLSTRQPVAIFKLVLSPPSEGTLLCFSLSLLFACPATAQHTSIIHCLSPGFQAKPITDGVLLMGSYRTCQQAICAQATTL